MTKHDKTWRLHYYFPPTYWPRICLVSRASPSYSRRVWGVVHIYGMSPFRNFQTPIRLQHECVLIQTHKECNYMYTYVCSCHARVRSTVTKYFINRQQHTHFCTCHTFHCDKPGVHSSPDPFSQVQKGAGHKTRICCIRKLYELFKYMILCLCSP